jgi:DNA polymerase III subunit epsilon
MREIVLDTETTGLDPLVGHRVIEIGCVELINHLATGKTFQTYLDPERDVPAEAAAVSGLTTEFVKGKPKFAERVDEFLAFVGDSPIIAHNASFDLGFINSELMLVGRAKISSDRTIDTVTLARRKFPGAPASLDALCRRFNIDLSGRVKHGALLDSQLLAQVYLELIGGREPGLLLNTAPGARPDLRPTVHREPRAVRPHAATAEELAAHKSFITKIKNAIWLKAS